MAAKPKGSSNKDKPPIDWQSVRQRLDAFADSLNRGPDPGREKAILRARARKLAVEPSREDISGELVEFLEFSLAYETYGIEMTYVDETLPLRGLTPLPCTPPFVLGLINVRGRILSVIDIKRFFDLPDKGLTDLNKVIVVRDEGMEFGILADAILGVRTVPRVDLETSLPTLTGLREEYLKGVTRERTVVLDGKKILSDRRIVVNEEV